MYSEIVILAMLHQGPRHGYEIKKDIKRARGDPHQAPGLSWGMPFVPADYATPDKHPGLCSE